MTEARSLIAVADADGCCSAMSWIALRMTRFFTGLLMCALQPASIERCDIFLESRGGQRHDRNRLAAWCGFPLPDRARRCEAVFFGHLDVHQDQVVVVEVAFSTASSPSIAKVTVPGSVRR